MIPSRNLLLFFSFFLFFLSLGSARFNEGELFKASLYFLFFSSGSIIFLVTSVFIEKIKKAKKIFSLILALSTLLLSIILLKLFPGIKPPVPDPFITRDPVIFNWHSILSGYFPLSGYIIVFLLSIRELLIQFTEETDIYSLTSGLSLVISLWGISRAIPPMEFTLTLISMFFLVVGAFLVIYLKRKTAKNQDSE
ncbi:MAG: hypothetical protein JXR95_07505 [Deltaproteobacteria bacterium]|nr:hypothetical protein [Deltaproteobacteria bacterium]